MAVTLSVSNGMNIMSVITSMMIVSTLLLFLSLIGTSDAFLSQQKNPTIPLTSIREWDRILSISSKKLQKHNNLFGRKTSGSVSTNSRLWGGGGAADLPFGGNEDNEDFFTPWGRNKARTDIRYFLTQRSIQSFVYLLNQCREEHTVQFLERTLEFTNIEKYHGLGAFNHTKFPNWDSIFLDYVDRPEEIIVMTVKQRQRRRSSLSGRNSYLDNMTPSSNSKMKKKTTKPNLETKDNNIPKSKPPRGIAGNYLESLNSNTPTNDIPTASNQKPSSDDEPSSRRTPPKGITGNYLENLSSSTISNGPKNDDGLSSQSDEVSQNPYMEEKTIEYELEVDPSAVVRRILAVREQISQEWIHDLDTLMQLNDDILEAYEEFKEHQREDPTIEDDEEDDEFETKSALNPENNNDLDYLVKKLVEENMTNAESSKEKRPVFDINAWHTWSQSLFSQDRDSSPFRKKNFDLLLLLSTQESVHRVLKAYKNDDSVRPETYEWLLDFYKEHVSAHFDGNQSFGRAEQFLEKMLRSPPTMIETDTKALGVLAWVDPAQIAEDIVRERSEVALAWMQVAKAAQDEHTDLRRLLFTNSFSKAEPTPSISDTIIDPIASNNPDSIAFNSTVGAFE